MNTCAQAFAVYVRPFSKQTRTMEQKPKFIVFEDIHELYSVRFLRKVYGDIEDLICEIFSSAFRIDGTQIQLDQLDPARLDAYDNLAEKYATGRLENVLGLFYDILFNDQLRAIEYFEKSAAKHFCKAFISLTFCDGYKSRAIELYKKAIQYGEDRGCIYSELAREMLIRNYERGELTTAEEELEAHNYLVIAAKKNDIKAIILLAILYSDRKNYPAARHYLNRAKEILVVDVDYVDKTKIAGRIAKIEKEIDEQERVAVEQHGYIIPENPVPVFTYAGENLVGALE
jgi:tetratricopeptide (TPR) repeat protein